jgi:lysophospholipase L1-like esterase
MMKRMIGTGALLATMLLSATAQTTEPVDSSYANSWYQQRMDFFRHVPKQKKAIVFLGNSITEAGDWQELIAGKPVQNRGISGDVSFGVLARLDETLAEKPAKIFLLIGVNDIKRGTPVTVIANNQERIIQQIKALSPRTRVYIQSVLPVHEPVLAEIYKKITNERIKSLNSLLKEVAVRNNVPFVDLHPVFVDENGQLKRDMTTDGLHLRPAAYIKWVASLKEKKLL